MIARTPNIDLAIAGLVAAYVALAVLLLSLNLTSLWRWWIKAGAIVVTTLFLLLTWQALPWLVGWPTSQRLPPRFNVVWTEVAEPDHKTGSPGAIYLWAEALDANNVPAVTPRSYRLPYTDRLARRIAEVQERRRQGKEVMGRLLDVSSAANQALLKNIKMGRGKTKKGEASPGADTVPFTDPDTRLGFQDLPPVALPDKGPL